MEENNQFTKSDIGAQAAWKGFSSQTLYTGFQSFWKRKNFVL
ncbi:hypothetical protein [Ruminiclostridium hungatei]|nr:hypothetical protein [Ruminiclostridium hungatei]